ncbi:helix-turn-helix transcriptional regulator [Rhodococcus zopfii]|uniref:helix-turn-helix transcriptional regulator n=1 Tax=Rhodococcus zopfii TaxID=43772 RepID=UPI00365BF82A
MERNNTRRLVTVAQAAEYCEMGVSTLRRYIAEGRVPAHRIGPKMVRLDLDELDAVLTARKPTAAPTSDLAASREDILHMVDAAPDLTSAQKDIVRAVLGGGPVAATES